MPVLFYIIIGLVIVTIYLVIWPTIRYFFAEVKARCKPKYFPYSHVVITGCGTGLGKALVEKIFQRGAMITMIGKDKAKLQQLMKEIDVSTLLVNLIIVKLGQSTVPLINYVACDITTLSSKKISNILDCAE